MRPIALLTAALAAAATACGTETPCPDGVGTDTRALDTFSKHASFRSHGRHSRMAQKLEARASGQAFGALSTKGNLCVDVANNNLANGGRVQLWQCANSDNQRWRIEGPLLQTSADLCLDLPGGTAYNGAPLQVWKCDGSNHNQFWTATSDGQVQWSNSNYCLDVTGGRFSNGNMLQLWTCYPGSQNQQFWPSSGMSAAPAAPVPAPAPAPQGGTSSGTATTWLGHWAISLDDFVAKHPECQTYKPAILAAANDQGINPTFLASVCEVESSCGAGLKGSPNAWAGPWQFMDDNAWNKYGGAGKDRLNYWDAAFGAARYFKALLGESNWNLDVALRNYNGPVNQGGDPAYQAHVYSWMSGGHP